MKSEDIIKEFVSIENVEKCVVRKKILEFDENGMVRRKSEDLRKKLERENLDRCGMCSLCDICDLKKKNVCDCLKFDEIE